MSAIAKLLGTFGPKIGGALIFLAALFQPIGASIDGNDKTVPDWNLEMLAVGLGALGIGFGARANLKTSEAAGALGPVVKEQAPIIEAEKIAAAEAKPHKTVEKQLAAVETAAAKKP